MVKHSCTDTGLCLVSRKCVTYVMWPSQVFSPSRLYANLSQTTRSNKSYRNFEPSWSLSPIICSFRWNFQSFKSNMELFGSNIRSFNSNMHFFNSNNQSTKPNIPAFDSNINFFKSNMQTLTQNTRSVNSNIQSNTPVETFCLSNPRFETWITWFKHIVFSCNCSITRYFKHSFRDSNIQLSNPNIQFLAGGLQPRLNAHVHSKKKVGVSKTTSVAWTFNRISVVRWLILLRNTF